jgi:hypothetical protein
MGEFKVIVAGGRDFNNFELLRTEIWKAHKDIGQEEMSMAIVSGMARGADAMGASFAHYHGIKLYKFPADWDQHGKAAGFIRNKEMGDFADGLLAFWDGQSRGTKHMIDYMRSLDKPIVIVEY